MSDAFGVVESMVYPRLGVELVDVRSIAKDQEQIVRHLWHSNMQSFLKGDDTFGFQETCTNEEACLGPLQNAYVDHAEAERAAGREPLSWEAFSAANFDRLIPDFISKPHLDLHWFGIRLMGARDFTGGLLISNIYEVKMDSRLLTLGGWPVAVHPAIDDADEATVAGAISRFVMDNDLITVSPSEPDVDFVEWSLPTDVDSRYVTRGRNTYGSDVFEEMADGVKVRFGDATVDSAPIGVKRELQPADDPTDYEDYTRPLAVTGVEAEPAPVVRR